MSFADKARRLSWSITRGLLRPFTWVGARRTGEMPKSWSAPQIHVADPGAPARDRFSAEMRADGTLSGVVVGGALASPGGYNNQPVAVVVTDSESGLIVVKHRFAASSPNLGHEAAEHDLDTITTRLDTMTVGQFCDTYAIPR